MSVVSVLLKKQIKFDLNRDVDVVIHVLDLQRQGFEVEFLNGGQRLAAPTLPLPLPSPQQRKSRDRKAAAAAVQSLRKDHNLTQAQMADLLRVSCTTIQQWEKGAWLPSHSAWERIDELQRRAVDGSVQRDAAVAAASLGPKAAGAQMSRRWAKSKRKRATRRRLSVRLTKQDKLEMVELRKKGLKYRIIGRRFKISESHANRVIREATGEIAPRKPSKTQKPEASA